MSENEKKTLFDEYKERVKVIRGIDIGPGGTFEIFCDLVEEKIEKVKLEILETMIQEALLEKLGRDGLAPY